MEFNRFLGMSGTPLEQSRLIHFISHVLTIKLFWHFFTCMCGPIGFSNWNPDSTGYSSCHSLQPDPHGIFIPGTRPYKWMPSSGMDRADRAVPGTVSAEVPVDNQHQAPDKWGNKVSDDFRSLQLTLSIAELYRVCPFMIKCILQQF